MGLIGCCFSGFGGPGETTANSPSGPCSSAPSGPALGLSHHHVPVRKCLKGSFIDPRPESSAPSVPILHAGLLQEVQLSLGCLEADGFEARAAQVASTVQEHLGPTAIVRLYGLHPDDGNSQPLCVVQLAASAGSAVAGLQWAKERLPGQCFVLSNLRTSASGPPSLPVPHSTTAASSKAEGNTRLLLERALSSKKPATFRLSRTRRSPIESISAMDSTLPRDCAADVGVIRSLGPVTFAAVPLAYGKHLMGALWMAVADSDAARGDQPWDDSATASSSQAARAQALLTNGSGLEQLGMSASVALALATGGDFEYLAWLAACVRRLAVCATLHTLVAGICTAISEHLRLRFRADVTVQSALVPEHDSHVAFMLCPETSTHPVASLGGGSLGPPGTLVRAAVIRDSGPEGGYQCRNSTIQSCSARQLHPAAPQVMQTTLEPAAGGTDEGLQASATGVAHTAHTVRPQAALPERPGASEHRLATGASGAVSPFCTTTVIAAVNRNLIYSDPSDGSIGPCVFRSTAPVLCMSAKAFQLSHTLLSRLVSSARAQQSPAQVPAGIVVPDTARHVADVRQPSRDVCMLIGAKSAAGGFVWQQCRNAGGRNSMELSGSRSGPSSLILLAMEVAEGGCMLGLYVAFPTLMPQPLLAAARESCEQLLRQVLVGLIRHKLCTPELGPDLDTLRAGVPGSYVSVSRVRNHMDQLQLPMAPSPQFPPPPNGEGLALEPPNTTNAQELEAHLAHRMAAWSVTQGTPQTRSRAVEPNVVPRSVSFMSDVAPPVWDADAPGEGVKNKAGQSPLSAAKKLLLTRASWVVGASISASAPTSSIASLAPQAQAPSPEIIGTLQLSAGAQQGMSGSVRLARCTSGPPSCAADGSHGGVSAVMLDSTADGPEARFAQAAMMTVHGVDDTWGMRGMMGALVESVMTTLRVSASELADEAFNRSDVGWRAVEGLEDLHLADVLGHGANGVVLQGTLGTVPVAVKLMEMPDADYDVLSAEVESAPEELLVKSLTSMAATVATPYAEPPRKEAEPQQLGQQCKEQDLHHGGRQQTESQQMRARRTLLRNATELAVMRLVSHVCIVQVFAVYDNVYMEKIHGGGESIILRRVDPKNPDTGGSPICTAIVQELCDRGSLADVLAERSFPVLLPARGQGAAASGGSGAAARSTGASRSVAQVVEIDMKGVYLTLLEIALALRHIHSRRLVHRDIKPANILLKISPGDPRGWTCKLADFGFALVLDQQGVEVRDDCSKQMAGSCSSASTGSRTWYTVQSEASGTVTHMAPEAMKKNSRIDASVDIYALGIIFWELACGRGQRPFRHLEPTAIPTAVVSGMRPAFTGDVPAPYRRMAQACWAQDPHRRPRAADVVGFIKAQLSALV